MLNDATCFREVYIVCGYTDLRSGMDRLAAVIEAKTGTSPYVPGALYLFCGRRLDRIKGLEKQKAAILAPKPPRKPRKTKKQKIQDLMKQAQKAGLKPEEIAERLGLTIQD